MNKISSIAFASFALLAFASAEKPATADTRASVCFSNADCGGLQFCNIEGADGVCGGQGVCAPRGINLMCSMLFENACGCDGKPYANHCIAHKAGVSVDPMPFKSTSIDGDTLAEQPWMDPTQSYFYSFTGNGTDQNYSGTFTQNFEPPCTRAQVRCMIAAQQKRGTFVTFGSFVELDFDNGDVAFFDAQLDCHNSWKLVSDDGTSAALVPSTILP